VKAALNIISTFIACSRLKRLRSGVETSIHGVPVTISRAKAQSGREQLKSMIQKIGS
jgi:hypothetical protein